MDVVDYSDCFHIILGDPGQNRIASGLNCYLQLKAYLRTSFELQVTVQASNYLVRLLRASVTFVTFQSCWDCKGSCVSLCTIFGMDGIRQWLWLKLYVHACTYMNTYNLWLEGHGYLFVLQYYVFRENHTSFVFLYFLAASGLWISCMFFYCVGREALGNVWTVAVHRVYDSAINDLPQYRVFFGV